MGDKLKESLKLTSGIGPEVSDEEVNIARQVIMQFNVKGGEDPKKVIMEIREQIHKYRHKKMLADIRMAQVTAAEKVVIERLNKLGF